jgi:CBS domain-containing protein
MNGKSNTFENTLVGLSNGLQVWHIATFHLQTCAPNEHVTDVLGRFAEFDQIPVKDSGTVIGVLERNGNLGEFVVDQMRRLDDSILVSANEPLLDFIPLMIEVPFYRLVLSGTRIDGIVTRSDLLKLPVRLLGFAMVTHLEQVMMDIISLRLPKDQDWLALLSKDRQEKIKNKQEIYQKKRMDPSLLELTDFSDKRTILTEHLRLGSKFTNDLSDIKDLRNMIAHAANFAPGEAELRSFINNFQNARRWIEELNSFTG